MQLKGLAKAIDIVMLKHENGKILNELHETHGLLQLCCRKMLAAS